MIKFDVIGIGASSLDILNIVDHFPTEEEVQESYEIKIDGGGPVATAIVTLARLGCRTMMIDNLGNDWRGKLILEKFKNENVNTELLKVFEGRTSQAANLLIRKNDGARTIMFLPGNAPEVSAEQIDEKIISSAKFIHISGRHYDVCLLACGIAKKVGTKISFDGGSHRFREDLKIIVKFSDVCIVAKEFAFSYSKEESINEAGKKLLNEGPEIVIITDGPNGSFLFNNEIAGYHQKAYLVENTVDTTGCGDSYHGAFLFGLCSGKDVFESMKIASAVAAINSTGLGGRTALPDLKTVEEFLIRFE